MSYPVISGYKIISKIGEGAMSAVFEAEDANNNKVAIKILHGFLKDKQTYTERIEKEASNLKLLNDERIVKLFSVQNTTDKNIALIQELVKGKNLEELLSLDQNRKRPVIGALIVSEVLLGLEEAHRHDIIHRDLKPENIMLTKTGRIKITDFGVSKNLTSDQLTVSGSIIGTPAYISPEQIKGASIDQRADLFSLGVLLYRIATGELPFKDNDYSSLLNSILTKDPTPPQKLNPKIHPELLKIINKALDKNLNNRFQRAYEFRYHLMKYLDLICAPSPQKLLEEYFEKGPKLDEIGEERLVSTMIVRAEASMKAGDVKSGTQLIQQILSLDPTNKKARGLLTKRKFKFSLKAFATLAILILLLLSGLFFMQNNQKSQEVVIPEVTPKVETPAVLEVKAPQQAIIEPKKVEKKVPLPTPAPVVKEEPTMLQFNVDSDVTVYLDGEEILNPEEGPKEVKDGDHAITLKKPGHEPIVSKVTAIKNQTTVINAKTTKEVTDDEKPNNN